MSTWSKSRVAKPRIFAARFSAAGSSPIRAAISISEITVENEALAEGLVALMAERNIKARILRRRNSYIVYLKSGTAISAFLAFVGAHQCALAMENERVRKSVRNDINRKVNAELANQAKSAEAAIDQIVSIRKLAESGKVAESSSRAPGVRASSPSLSRCQLERARRAGDPPFRSRRCIIAFVVSRIWPAIYSAFRAAFVFGSTRRRLGAAGLFATPPRFFLWLGSPTFKPFVLEILSRCLHLMVESCRFYPLSSCKE